MIAHTLEHFVDNSKLANIKPYYTSGLLLIGFLIALALRVSVGGVGVAQSPIAGLVFGICLTVISITAGLSFRVSKRIILIGLAGALVLCLPALVKQLGSATYLPYGNYLSWSIVVSFVALSEEAFLRGVLFKSVKAWGGSWVAVLVGALVFCALHVPLYGWHIVPLDFVVGIWLGILRAKSGSWVAPGITHTVADLSTWWLI